MNKITFPEKLTCLCRLTLLCHIPQEVLLNTNFLWKDTITFSTYRTECWLLIHVI